MEVESPADGTLVRLTAAEGDVVRSAPHRHPRHRGRGPARRHPGPPRGSGPHRGTGRPVDPAPGGTGRPAAAGTKPAVPAARRRAAELGVDGRRHRHGARRLVRVADVEAAAAPARRLPRRSRWPGAGGPGAGGGGGGDPLSSMRRVVARRLVESMRSTPHFYLTASVDAEELLGFGPSSTASSRPAVRTWSASTT